MSASFVLAQWHPWWQFASPLMQALLNASLTLAVAPLSFRLIERPCIALGRWIGSKKI
jgi:peptidoglycan/LPS O-acetylase OafA/YrhL